MLMRACRGDHWSPVPQFVIVQADEPTGNLDRDTQKEIMEIFRTLADQGKCVILVSHSPDVAAMCDERCELVKVTGGKKKKQAQ